MYIKIKRLMDIVISIVALIVLIPIFIIIVIAIKIDSKGSIFFAHNRIGKNGKSIKVYKFRTMCEDAEDKIKDFSIEQMQEYKKCYKLKNDPRVTKVGKFLRKTKLDELPQLFNVVMGELSLIGPRPIIQEELKNYGQDQKKFLSVTPGITGYWQVNDNAQMSYKERMNMELYYVDNMCFALDVKIFFKTIMLILKGIKFY